MFLREFTGPAAELLEKYAGLRLDPMWSTAVVGASLLLLAAFTIRGVYRWLRRNFRNGVRALALDRPGVVETIAQDVKGIEYGLHDVQQSPGVRLATHPDPGIDESKIDFNDNAPAPPQPQPRSDVTAQKPMGPKLRKQLALRVRDAVMEKFREGGWFREQPQARQTYVFRKTSHTRAQFEFTLETPTFDTLDGEPAQRDAYALHIRVDGRKKLNLAWRADGEPALRYLSVGDWVDVVTNWKFAGPGQAPAAAAESKVVNSRR